MAYEIPLQPKDNIGFTYLRYDDSEKISLTLYLPDFENNKGYTKTHRVWEIVSTVANIPPIEDAPPYTAYIVQGTRKVYQALQWLEEDANYSLSEDNIFTAMMERMTRKMRQKPLPPFSFWTQNFQPSKKTYALDAHLSKIEIQQDEKNNVYFSRIIELDTKLHEDTQVNSIYYRALLGKRASLDVLLFDEDHARRRLNSLEIKNFTSMQKLKAEGRIPSMLDFVEKGSAGLDVACLVFKEMDRNFSNYGLAGKFVKIDHNNSAWDFVSKYYNVDPNKPYLFTQKKSGTEKEPGTTKEFKITAMPPARSFDYTAVDIEKLPFVENVQFINSPVHSLLGRYFPGGDLTLHLRGMHKHPDYIREKFYYFLKTILIPDSFHGRVVRGFMSPSKHLEERIHYRQSCIDQAKDPLFLCNDFWLYLKAYPQWVSEIIAEFAEFNQEIKEFFKVNNLLDKNAVQEGYLSLVNSEERVSSALKATREELQYLVEIYKHCSDKHYRSYVETLAALINELIQCEQDPQIIPPIDAINQLKYQIYQFEMKKNDYSLLDDVIDFYRQKQRNINSGFVEDSQFDLLEAVFSNKIEKVNSEIVAGQVNDQKLNEKTPYNLTFVELALACGHQQIAEMLLRQESPTYTPSFDNDPGLHDVLIAMRNAAKDYFLKLCELQKQESGVMFSKKYDMPERMNDIFKLFLIFNQSMDNGETLKLWIDRWVKEVKEDTVGPNELCKKIMTIVNESFPENQKTQESPEPQI